MEIKPLTLKEVQEMAEKTGYEPEYIISTLPLWVQESPQWSAAYVRSSIRHRQIDSLELGEAGYHMLDNLGIIRFSHRRDEVLRLARDLCTETVSVRDNENDCFLRYEDAPILVPSDEIIPDGYEFEPLTLAEVDEYHASHLARPFMIAPSWIKESAAWSSSLVRARGFKAFERDGGFRTLWDNGAFTWHMEAGEVLAAVRGVHPRRSPVSIRDSERGIFVRPSTGPRLVRIDPA